jgi:hypothetical protein
MRFPAKAGRKKGRMSTEANEQASGISSPRVDAAKMIRQDLPHILRGNVAFFLWCEH